MSFDLILSGKSAQGESYLKEFLKDYTALTHEVVNAQCVKCLKRYYKKYINLTAMSENTSNYRLHKKREGMQLAFGSSIIVTNNNITDEYAEALIKRFSKTKPDFCPSYLFSKYPVKETEIEVEVEVEVEKETVASKPKKRRTKAKSNG